METGPSSGRSELLQYKLGRRAENPLPDTAFFSRHPCSVLRPRKLWLPFLGTVLTGERAKQNAQVVELVGIHTPSYSQDFARLR